MFAEINIICLMVYVYQFVPDTQHRVFAYVNPLVRKPNVWIYSNLDSKFLFKVYHDNNEIDDEVDDYFELVTQTGLNFVKGVRFSYLSDCRIFGGPLTWFNAKFSKTY
jgi:hypothetical protein